MSGRKVKVEARFTQQQLQVLNTLKGMEEFGADYEHIITNIFRKYLKEKKMKGGT